MRLSSFSDLLVVLLLAVGLGWACLGAGQSAPPWYPAFCGALGAILLLWRFAPLTKRQPPHQPTAAVEKLHTAGQAATEDRSHDRDAGNSPCPKSTPEHDQSDSPSDRLVAEMIAQGREVLLLRPQIAANLTPSQLESAQEQLDEEMAVVPQGIVVLLPGETDRAAADEVAPEVVDVEGLYIDRYPVTNRQFKAFVDAGGYEEMSLWDESIWPAVLQFIDTTRHPGPRFWENGTYPKQLADHPVVGVSWYEACAYARWVGKRLPTDPEWVKAGAWPVGADTGLPTQRRFPWGDSMDRKLAHLWGPDVSGTVPVTRYADGASVGGVHQLIGNVWEWTASPFATWSGGERFFQEKPLKSIRGGAFDTYFDNQASCQFQSGEDPLARKHNIGFRCAVGLCDVVPVGWDDPELSPALPCDPAPEEALT